MKQIFQIGDVVVHKDLGRRMMVIYDMLGSDFRGEQYFNGNYRCAWYEGNEELKTENYSQESLEFQRRKNPRASD